MYYTKILTIQQVLTTISLQYTIIVASARHFFSVNDEVADKVHFVLDFGKPIDKSTRTDKSR